MIKRFRSYLADEGQLAVGIVLAYALALSFMVCRSLVERLPRQYDPDFGAAHWIQMHGTPPATYFRKTIFLSGVVDRAWLELAATGKYELYVDNVKVDVQAFPGIRLSGVYDLKPLLSPGKNVIAIHVFPGHFEGPSQIIVRGAYRVVDSPGREIISDSGWKVSPTPDGVIGSYYWSSPELEDRLWANAETGVDPDHFSTVQQLALDPRLLEDPQFADWIMPRREHASDAGSQVSFEGELNLASRYSETWLQVATGGAYDVLVNGHLVGMAPTPTDAMVLGRLTTVDLVGRMATSVSLPHVVTPWFPMAGNTSVGLSAYFLKPLKPTQPITIDTTNDAPDAPDWIPTTLTRPTGVSAPELSDITQPPATIGPQFVPLPSNLGAGQATVALTAYDISDVVHAGNNSITIRVRAPAARGPTLLLAEGLTTGTVDGMARRFGTDHSWTTVVHDPATGSSPAEPAIVVTAAGQAPWGPLPQVVANAQWLPQRDIRSGLRWAATTLACIAFVAILWWGAAPLLARDRISAEQLWTTDAFVQLPMLLGLLALFGSTFDVRTAYDWCFQPTIAVVFILLLPLSKLVLLTARSRDRSSTAVRPLSIGTRSLWVGVALAGITLVGLVLRAWGLNALSMAHDEVAIVMASQGVLRSGVPRILDGSFVKYLATYELVPYPIALSTLLLGPTVIAYRLPSLIFGSCTIFLIGWVGYRMMSWRVGLVAAFIYAFLPTAIGWSRDCFYPAEESFYSLMAAWLFFEAINGPELNRRYLSWAAFVTVLAYFTWEGSGFILPTLFVAMVVLRWGDFRWMTDRHLWACLALVAAALIMQFCYRQLTIIPDYLGVVYDLSELSTPSLIFLDRIMFNPLFYLQAFFFADINCLLTLIVLVGLLFAWTNRALLYLYLSLGLYYVWYTGFLASYAPRYCFFWTPLLVLASVGTFFHLWDRLAALEIPQPGAALRWLALAGSTALLLLATNPYVTRLYRLSAQRQSPAYFSRLGVPFKPDYRSADHYVATHLRPGDAVVTSGPHVFQLDVGRPADYWVDAALAQRLTYDGGPGKGYYIDKWVGIPAIRGLQEFQEVNAKYSRMFVYTSVLVQSSPDVITYMARWGRVVHEGFDQDVILIPGAVPDKAPPIRRPNPSLAN